MSHRLSQLTHQLNYPGGLLANQTALITGGGQGIGAEIARLFANEGARVVIADIDGGASHYPPSYRRYLHKYKYGGMGCVWKKADE